jgi:hypothetical protein
MIVRVVGLRSDVIVGSVSASCIAANGAVSSSWIIRRRFLLVISEALIIVR